MVQTRKRGAWYKDRGATSIVFRLAFVVRKRVESSLLALLLLLLVVVGGSKIAHHHHHLGMARKLVDTVVVHVAFFFFFFFVVVEIRILRGRAPHDSGRRATIGGRGGCTGGSSSGGSRLNSRS
jgi:hypothetical protein